MPLLPRLSSLCRNLFRKARREQELAEEIDAYLEMLVEQKIKDGLNPVEARRAALIELGGKEQVKAQVREVRMGYHIETLWQDVRYAARSLRKHALLSAVVIATLTLGIGISAGVFTLINALVLRARVDKDPDSFARIFSSYTRDASRLGRLGQTTLEDYLAFRAGLRSLRDVAAWAECRPNLEDDPAEVRVLLVTDNYFSLYTKKQPKLGRLLRASDYAAADPVVVLSERLWRDRFASDPQIIGKVARFSNQPVTVVGVVPAFASPFSATDAWFPYTLQSYMRLGDDLQNPSESAWLNVEGRLVPGFSRHDAAAELALLASQQDRLHPGRKSATVVTDGSWFQQPDWRNSVIWIISLTLGMLTMVALIVCVNVTTLLLARAHSRQQEIAIRLALGAGRTRLIRMLLSETLLLAAIAGAASLLFVYRMPDLLNRWLIAPPFEWPLTPDWRVFTYLSAVTLLAGTLAGLAPSLQSLKVNLSDSLKGRPGLLGAMAGRSRLLGLLIATQVALSFVLLAGATIFVRAYRQMARADSGFETRQVLVTRSWVNGRPAIRSWGDYHRALTQCLAELPGVQSVAYAIRLPYAPGDAFTLELQAPDQPARQVAMNAVSPEFFETLSIPIISGRSLKKTDSPCGQSVCSVVVSQSLARAFWPGRNPLGQWLRNSRGAILEVAGVARDTSSQRIGSPDGPLVYLPWAPNGGPYAPLTRFTDGGAALSRAVTATLRDLAPELEVETQTIQSLIDQQIDAFWKLEALTLLLALLAVFLAMIGIYGVVSFAVSQRVKELGIRVALGARPRDIYVATLGVNLRPIAYGLLVGLALALAGATTLARVLRPPHAPFTVDAGDPFAYVAAAALLTTVALAAMAGPSRRAAKLDPVVALRRD